MKVTILGLILCLAALAQTPDQALAGQASRESIARRVTESFDIRGLPQASLLTSALRLDSDRELRKQRKTAIETYLSSSFSGARFTLNYCPVKSRIESVGWGHRVSFRGSRTAARPVKWAFSRKG